MPLSFAAGAMSCVVAEELIHKSQAEKHSDIATIGGMVGFAIMMTLDVGPQNWLDCGSWRLSLRAATITAQTPTFVG
jgi:hypothetical protein